MMQKQKTTNTRKILFWTGMVLLCPFVFVFLLMILIYLPPVQNWAVKQVASIASEQTGYDITIEHVDLDFPLDLGIDGISITTSADTIANIGRAVVDIRLLPLLTGDVVVDELTIQDAKVNTIDIISDVQVKGSLGTLTLEPSRIELTDGNVTLSHLSLKEADVTVLLSDTAAVDTTESGPTLWRITLDKLAVTKTQLAVHMPGDSMLIAGYMGDAAVLNVDLDLATGCYQVGKLDWNQGRLIYDLPYESRQEKGMDYSHLDVSDISLGIDSFYFMSPVTKLTVRHATMKEQCGLEISELRGDVAVSDTHISLPSLMLRTPLSDIIGRIEADFSVADSINPGQMDVNLNSHLAISDIEYFVPQLPSDVVRHSPAMPLTLNADIKGNMQHANVNNLLMEWPTAFKAETKGQLHNLTDTDRLKAQIDLEAQTYNLRFLTPMLGLPKDVNIPGNMSLHGDMNIDGPLYQANLKAIQGNAYHYLTAQASLNQKTEKYDLLADISNLKINQFINNDSLSDLTLFANIKGRGFDFTKRSTWLDAEASVDRFRYGQKDLDSITLMAHLRNGHAQVDINGQNSVFNGNVCIDGLLGQKSEQSVLNVNSRVDLLDLYALGLVEDPLQIGVTGKFSLDSDLKDTHKLKGFFSEIYLRDSLDTFNPQDLGVLLAARPDTTYARLQNGNLILKFDGSGHYETLIDKLTTLVDTMKAQFENRVIDQQALKRLLPTMKLFITSGRDNPLADILRVSQNIDFKDRAIDLTASAEHGLNGNAHLYGLNADSTRIDTIAFTLKDTSHGLTFQGRVANNRRNPQFVFTATADGVLQEHGASFGIRFLDSHQQLGLRLGAKTEMEANGLRFKLMPSRPTIGYKEFTLNDDNFIYLRNDYRLQAKVDLVADDGTGVKIYSEDQDSTMLQDLTVSLNRLDLDQLTAAIPYVPRIAGRLDGDYHLMMDGKRQISVASDMQVKDMTYEGSPMGTLATEFVYLQREDETHAVEGVLMQNGREIATLQGNYRNKKVTGSKEHLDGTLALERAPLSLINGFVPDQLIGLEGFAEGELSVEGSLSNLDMDGEVLLDSAFLISVPYGVRLRFDNDPVRIEDSRLLLENFTMYAYNDNPLNIQGNIDFGELDNMSMDVRMRATNYQLINAKQTAKSLAYGKAFVNFYAILRGPMDRLHARQARRAGYD